MEAGTGVQEMGAVGVFITNEGAQGRKKGGRSVLLADPTKES